MHVLVPLTLFLHRLSYKVTIWRRFVYFIWGLIQFFWNLPKNLNFCSSSTLTDLQQSKEFLGEGWDKSQASERKSVLRICDPRPKWRFWNRNKTNSCACPLRIKSISKQPIYQQYLYILLISLNYVWIFVYYALQFFRKLVEFVATGSMKSRASRTKFDANHASLTECSVVRILEVCLPHFDKCKNVLTMKILRPKRNSNPCLDEIHEFVPRVLYELSCEAVVSW